MNGVDLDRLAAGCASIAWSKLDAIPGAIVGVRALSDVEWSECMRTAHSRVDAGHGRMRDVARRHEEMIEAVVRCVVAPGESGCVEAMLSHDDARDLESDALFELYEMVVRERRIAHGFDVADEDAIATLEASPRFSMDRARAMHAVALHAYYGVHARHLTDWQVLLYLHLVRRDD